jgi:hypothetical protein
MPKVERFYPSVYPGEMEGHPTGGWVRFEDYEALKAALADALELAYDVDGHGVLDLSYLDRVEAIQALLDD